MPLKDQFPNVLKETKKNHVFGKHKYIIGHRNNYLILHKTTRFQLKWTVNKKMRLKKYTLNDI